MKKTTLLALGMFLCSLLIAQNSYQTEIICPCTLEFQFPQSIADGSDLLQAFGGVPILRFDEALVEGNKLVCKYSTAFAKFVFDGFGFVIDRAGGLSSIPHDLTLTLDEKFLSDWTVSRKTVKLPHYHRGDVVYTISSSTGNCYSFSGGLYKSEYNGKQISLKRSFENEARVNNEGTGFITADTQSGLFSPVINNDDFNNQKKSNQTVTKVNSKELPSYITKDSTKAIKKKKAKKRKKN